MASCTRQESNGYQGYLEGEFIYVASPLAGQLVEIAAPKGTRVQAGAPLFAIESEAETAALRAAESELLAARARLEDLRKGARPPEIAALEARLAQARAVANLSRLDFERQQALFESRVSAESGYDQARANFQRNQGAVDEIEAQLATARLGGRPDAIAAAEAAVAAAEANRQRSAWTVGQKRLTAARAGLVYDTLFRAGEFVPAGRPVVALLPPENLKVRFFVPEADLASIQAGAKVQVHLTGASAPIAATVNYVSPRPEFTPPVLYNRENRAKLVYLVEAALEGAAAATLQPGRPVDVTR